MVHNSIVKKAISTASRYLINYNDIMKEFTEVQTQSNIITINTAFGIKHWQEHLFIMLFTMGDFYSKN